MGTRKKKAHDAPSPQGNTPLSSEQIASESHSDVPPSFRDVYKSSGAEVHARIAPVASIMGYGAHSVVYKGLLTGSGQSVVIKLNRRPILSVKGEGSEFDAVQQEVKWLKDLNYPSIARLIDWIPDWNNNCSYIVMQYIEGCGLNQKLADKGSFPQSQVLNWAFQILDAMVYLHNKRYVIGDFDPSSIVLTPDNRVCLVDFKYLDDIANRFEESPQEFFRHYGGMENGALQEGIHEDIRHLGATMFELLTTEKPEGLAPEARKRALLKKGVATSVVNVIFRAMSLKTEECYASAKEMTAALQALPAQDKRAKLQLLSLFLTTIFTIALFLTGWFSFSKGQYQIVRDIQMRVDAERALMAWRDGDYSRALSYALEASRQEGNDPSCPPEALDALSSVLSVYDFLPGYKPLYSNANLRGVPVRILLSPDERFLVSLVRDRFSDGFLFQIFDTASGKELNLFPLNGDLTDFVIRNDNLLIYADKNGVKGYSLSDQTAWTPKNASDFTPVRLTLSPDGEKAVVLSQNEQEAHTYPVSGDERSYVLRESFIPEEKRDAMDLRLLELDASGTRLAVSFSDGSIRVYRLDKPGEYAVLRKNSAYNHFEGGFYDAPNGDSYFFYASSQIFSPDSNEFGQVKSECRFYNVKSLDNALGNADEIVADYNLQMPRDGVMHTFADQSGMYFSVKDEIYHILPQRGENGTWGPYLETNGDVLYFRHDSESQRLLAVTGNRIVVLYEENNEVITRSSEKTLFDGISFQDATLSKRYLVLVGQNRISVMRWVDNNTERCASYPSDSFHTAARIRVDEDGLPVSVMLFHAHGFRIYQPDGKLVSEQSFDNWEHVLSVQYERVRDDSNRDYLKVAYEDETRYYSAVDGDLIFSKDAEVSPSTEIRRDDTVTLQTENFRVECSLNRDSAIYYARTLIKEIFEQPICVSEYQGQLLLSVLNIDGEHHSLLLDKHGSLLADFSGDCEVMPDGTLFVDTQQGYILRERVLSLDELREKAQDRRLETG